MTGPKIRTAGKDALPESIPKIRPPSKLFAEFSPRCGKERYFIWCKRPRAGPSPREEEAGHLAARTRTQLAGQECGASRRDAREQCSEEDGLNGLNV